MQQPANLLNRRSGAQLQQRLVAFERDAEINRGALFQRALAHRRNVRPARHNRHFRELPLQLAQNIINRAMKERGHADAE